MSFAACEVSMPLLRCPNFFPSTTYIKKMIFLLFFFNLNIWVCYIYFLVR